MPSTARPARCLRSRRAVHAGPSRTIWRTSARGSTARRAWSSAWRPARSSSSTPAWSGSLDGSCRESEVGPGAEPPAAGGASAGHADGRGRRRAEQLAEAALEPVLPHLAYLERQPDAGRCSLGGGARARRRPLREPQHARVAAEVGVAQLGVAVQAELAHHGVLERAREEVRQEVGARLVGERGARGVAAEHLVAVIAGEPAHARALEHRVERAVGAAVRIGDGEHVIVAGQPCELRLDRGGNALGPVVEQRRERVDVDRPAAPAGDRTHVDRERAAGDDTHAAHPGNASWSMKRSLKSVRPDSSTYVTSRTMECSSARSRTLSAAIFAPSPATLPADTMRGSAIRGTSPMRIALAGDRYAPNEPASSTCAMSSGAAPRSRRRMFQPVAIEALANCSSRTSRWERKTEEAGSDPRGWSTKTRSFPTIVSRGASRGAIDAAVSASTKRPE